MLFFLLCLFIDIALLEHKYSVAILSIPHMVVVHGQLDLDGI